jgi:uncharacterized membrane protein
VWTDELDNTRGGQSLPLFAICAVVIIGLVGLGLVGLGLDAAQTFVERRDAQGAADLAALSGARYLPGDLIKAEAEAYAIAAANGYPESAVFVVPNYQDDPSKI